MPLTDNFMENYRSCCTDSKTRIKVKAVGQDKCLDFNADRLEAKDWQPLLKALRNDRKLHILAIKSEYPGQRRKWWAERIKPAFHKQSIFDELIDSIAACMKRSDILSTVQLQSLPLSLSHAEKLAEGIRECTSLQNLLLTRFGLKDDGLGALYEAIYAHIGLSTIDFTGCDLTERGALTMAKLIRTQRLARYDETWKQSLRYREPQQELFPGIRRVTLNDNPDIGDKGFLAILHELMDDLWVKAVDVQNCGLTEVSGNESIKFLQTNDTVTILDLARNDKIPYEMRKQIKQILAGKEQQETVLPNGKPEGHDGDVNKYRQSYDWLESSGDPSKSYGSSRHPNSEFSTKNTMNGKSNKKSSGLQSHLTVDLHQTKRDLYDTRRNLMKEREKREELENEKIQQKKKLAEKFTKEWNKRKQIERERDRLKEELHVYLSEGHLPKPKSSSTSSSGSKTNKPKKKKPRTTYECYSVAKTNRTASTTDKRVKRKKSYSIKSKPSKKSLEKNKRQSGNDYEVRNTQQVHIMQKNLDKLNFNVSKKSQKKAQSQSSDSESEYKGDEKTQQKGNLMQVNNDMPRNNTAEKNPRDLSPISRSQWIFNKIIMGKSRKQKNIIKNHDASQNEKSFRLDKTPTLDIKV